MQVTCGLRLGLSGPSLVDCRSIVVGASRWRALRGQSVVPPQAAEGAKSSGRHGRTLQAAPLNCEAPQQLEALRYASRRFATMLVQRVAAHKARARQPTAA